MLHFVVLSAPIKYTVIQAVRLITAKVHDWHHQAGCRSPQTGHIENNVP
jgi:hypothetical protein